MTEVDRGYDLLFEMLNKTFEAAERAGVSVEDALPALVDFTAAFAIATSGEEGVDAAIARLQRRVDHWKNGHIHVQARTLH